MEEISYTGANSAVRRKPSKRLILFGTFFVIILLLLGSVAYFVTSGGEENNQESITLDQREESEVSEAIPTEEPEETEAPTPTKEPTPGPTESTTNRANIRVAIQNGSGVAGVAGEAAAILREAGYNVVSTGNADSFDYQDVTIQVKAARRSALSGLQSALSEEYTIGETSSDLSADATYDALVIIGQ
jgi:hypothetical protein